MSADHEYSGDYGYDMLHEVRSALPVPATNRALRPSRGGHAPGREMDPDGDFGYDQAHEL